MGRNVTAAAVHQLRSSRTRISIFMHGSYDAEQFPAVLLLMLLPLLPAAAVGLRLLPMLHQCFDCRYTHNPISKQNDHPDPALRYS
jgi:hypothetical protein